MKFKNYRNSYNNSNRIYSNKEVRNMRLSEIAKIQDELRAQYKAIGVPTPEALRASGNVIWIDEYTRDDGTKVSGHWRSLPDGDGFTTGAAAPVVTNTINSLPTTPKIIPDAHNYKTGEPLQQNWDKNGNLFYTNAKGEIDTRKMSKPQIWQQKLYESHLEKYYPIASGFVVDAMHNFANAKKDINAEVLQGMKQLKPSVRNALIEYGVPESSYGVIYNEKSSVSDSFSNSPQLKEWAHNPGIQEKIKNGTLTDKENRIHFNNKNLFSKEILDRYSSIQHAKIVNPKIVNGFLEGTIIDYYDFRERNRHNPINKPNNWGYDMQEKGFLQNYYICIKVKVKL